jgi:hypothetical protein
VIPAANRELVAGRTHPDCGDSAKIQPPRPIVRPCACPPPHSPASSRP